MTGGPSKSQLQGELAKFVTDFPRVCDEYARLTRGDQEDDESPFGELGPNVGHVVLDAATARPKLFDFQAEISSALQTWFVGSGSTSAALVSMPTGSGKTRTCVHAVLDLMGAGRITGVLWVAPSSELLIQARDTFESQWRGFRNCPDLHLILPIMLRGSAPRTNCARVTFVTPQLLLARQRQLGDWSNVDLLVFDEAHRAAAAEFRKAIELVQVAGRSMKVLGLTATPGRSLLDEIDTLVEQFSGVLITSRILGRTPVETLVRRGVLARIQYMDVSAAKAKGRPSSRSGDWSINEVMKLVLKIASKTAKRREKVLLFAESVAYANALTALLVAAGFAAGVVTGETQTQKRMTTLREFRQGRLTIVVSVDLLATGYDCPDVQHVILARSILSPILYEQMVGRVIRGAAVGGTSRSYVWDLCGNWQRHGDPASYMRYKNLGW